MDKFKIKNEPAEVELEAGTVGAQLVFSMLIEKEQANGTFLPMDLTILTIICDIRPAEQLSVAAAVGSFVVTVRGAGEPGWMDLSLSGAATTTLGEGDYEGSVKAYPVGQPTKGDILANVRFPLRFGATR